jgi:hypothetical protein
MKRALAALAVFTSMLTLVWIGGELHRRNCLSQGRSRCSALPWVGGHNAEPLAGLSRITRQRVLEAIERQSSPTAVHDAQEEANRLAGEEATRVP